MVPVISRRRFGKAICVFTLSAGTQAVCFDGGSTAKESSSDPDAQPIAYLETKRDTVVESQFGVSVPAPYRWLEGDLRADKNVAAWIDAQQRLTTNYLSSVPGRDVFRRSLASTYDYERLGIPQKSGAPHFFTRKAGNQNQPVLIMRGRRAHSDRSRDMVKGRHRRGCGMEGIARWGACGLCRAGRRQRLAHDPRPRRDNRQGDE